MGKKKSNRELNPMEQWRREEKAKILKRVKASKQAKKKREERNNPPSSTASGDNLPVLPTEKVPAKLMGEINRLEQLDLLGRLDSNGRMQKEALVKQLERIRQKKDAASLAEDELPELPEGLPPQYEEEGEQTGATKETAGPPQAFASHSSLPPPPLPAEAADADTMQGATVIERPAQLTIAKAEDTKKPSTRMLPPSLQRKKAAIKRQQENEYAEFMRSI